MTQPILDTTRRLHRSRWAAIGAAVAVSLGAGGIGVTHALVSTGAKPVYVAIAPCRLIDTRPAPDRIGVVDTLQGGAAGSAALPSPTTIAVADGAAHGNCAAGQIPAGPTSIALNVTALNASTGSNLQFAAGGSLVMDASSSLNPSPGAPPTPNAITVPLANNGSFDIVNRFGTVDVVIDVVGYYEDHNHDDRYYTKAQIDAMFVGTLRTRDGALVTLAESIGDASGPIGTPIVSHDFYSSATLTGDATVTRLASGRYAIQLPGFGDFQSVVVSGFDQGVNRYASCKVEGYTQDLIFIGCFDAAGTPEDQGFEIFATR
jgi:hypothetical protein